MIKYIQNLLAGNIIRENGRLKAENELLRNQIKVKLNVVVGDSTFFGNNKVRYFLLVDGEMVKLVEYSYSAKLGELEVVGE